MERPHLAQGKAILSAACPAGLCTAPGGHSLSRGTAHGQAELAGRDALVTWNPQLSPACGQAPGGGPKKGVVRGCPPRRLANPNHRGAGRSCPCPHPGHSPRLQSVPRNPGGQWQAPVAASQEPPLRHPHSCSQPGPNRPGGHPAGEGPAARGQGAHKAPDLPRHPSRGPSGQHGHTHVAGSRHRGSQRHTRRPLRQGGRPGPRRDTDTSAHSSPQRHRAGRLG